MSAISGPEDGPVAVTGASGFIGSEVVTNLVAHGYNVRDHRTGEIDHPFQATYKSCVAYITLLGGV